MAGALRYSRADAGKVALTPEGVAQVVAAARRAVLGQLALGTAIAAALFLAARITSGLLSTALAGLGFLALWGVLAALMAAWDHARTAKRLRSREQAQAEIARESDPRKFWWAHRGLFPYGGS